MNLSGLSCVGSGVMSGTAKVKFDPSNLAAIVNPKQLIEQATILSRLEKAGGEAVSSPPVLSGTEQRKNNPPGVDASMKQEMAISRQTILKQQRRINALTVQLSAEQERIALLEAQLEQLKQSSDRREQELTEMATLCQELQLRLQGQKGQAPQVQVGLEKCIELSGIAYSGGIRGIDLPLASSQTNLLHRAGIQPWSAPASPAGSLPLSSGEKTLIRRSDQPKKPSAQVDLPSFTRR